MLFFRCRKLSLKTRSSPGAMPWGTLRTVVAVPAPAPAAAARPRPILVGDPTEPTLIEAQLDQAKLMQAQLKQAQQRFVKGPKAKHSFTSWLISTWSGNCLFLLSCSGCCIFGFVLFWMVLPECDGCGTDRTFAQATWFAWCIFFDPGTQTGLAADGTVSHGQRLLAAIFSIGGFVFNLFLLGVVVDKIRNTLRRFETHNKASECRETPVHAPADTHACT